MVARSTAFRSSHPPTGWRAVAGPACSMSFQRCLARVAVFLTTEVSTLMIKSVTLVAAALAATCVVPAASAARTNPWFPLEPGSRWVYRGHDEGQRAKDVVTVTHRTKRIAGVRCRVVHDRVYHE